MSKLVCEKCGSDDVQIVCQPVKMNRRIGFFLVFFIAAMVFMAFAFVCLLYAYRLLHEEMNITSTDNYILALRQLWDNVEDLLIVPISALILSLMSIMVFLSVVSFRLFSEDEIKSQVVAVCPHCGENWIIPIKMHEYNEDEIYQVKMKRKQMLREEQAGDSIISEDKKEE